VRYITCPAHAGHIVENRPCPVCGSPQMLPVDRPPFRHSWEEEAANSLTSVAGVSTAYYAERPGQTNLLAPPQESLWGTP
jgi:hypothetical protein